jgi:hypothetical protein
VVAAFPEGAIEVHGVKLLWVKVNREWTGMNVNVIELGPGSSTPVLQWFR